MKDGGHVIRSCEKMLSKKPGISLFHSLQKNAIFKQQKVFCMSSSKKHLNYEETSNVKTSNSRENLPYSKHR